MSDMHDRRYVSVHVACGFTLDENVLPNAWIANKKGAEGINGQQKGGRGYPPVLQCPQNK